MEMSSTVGIRQQPTEDQQCKNCQSVFQGKYCPQCGQSVNDYERPLRFLIVDFAGNIFAFDTRVWRSLLTLLFKPGKMETEYTMGKRARYMPPFRMYIFMSFLFFLLLSITTNQSVQKGKVAFASALSQNNYGVDSSGAKNPSEAADFEEMNKILQQNAPEVFSDEAAGGKAMTNMQHLLDNPEMYLARFFKYLSWALFLLMPLYGFFLWVMFRKRKKYYLSHFLLSSNQHVFVFMILIVLLLIQLIFPNKTAAPEAWLLFLIPLYSMVGAHRLYQGSWISNILRLGTAQVIYSIVAAMATGLVVYISFFG